MGTLFNPEYDGKGKRYSVRCMFVCKHTGEQCPVTGECHPNPTSPRAQEYKVYCPGHGRDDERFTGGRNAHKRLYVMTVPLAGRKRAQEGARMVDRVRPKIRRPAASLRSAKLVDWLGSGYKECSPYHSRMILSQLRVPPKLEGDAKSRTHVYLFDSFKLSWLEHLYRPRADGRRLILARCNRVIFLHTPHAEILAHVGAARLVYRQY